MSVVFAVISWTAWNNDSLILRQNTILFNHSTGETIARPVVLDDGLTTLLCMFCHRKLENIEELKLKLKLKLKLIRHMRTPESPFVILAST